MSNIKPWSSILAITLIIFGCLATNANPKLIYSSISTAQIRLPEPPQSQIDTEPEQKPEIPPNPPSEPTEPPLQPSIDILQLNLSIIPANDRGILYDTSRPIDSSNPIRIINSDKGGYSSIFVQNDQYYNFSIGTIPTQGNGLKPPSNNKLDFKNIRFLPGAVLQSARTPLNLKLGNQLISESYSLGVTAHGRLRYTVTEKDFRLNGFLVPKGFIIIARRKAGLEHKGYPLLEDFEDFRVYDPSNSALVKIFNYNQLKSSKCLQNQCFNMNKFATPKNTWQFGAKVFSNFSTRDLFGSVSPWTANKLWISLQANLEAQTILRINSGYESWAKHVLEDFNEDEFNYINHINNFEMKQATNQTQRQNIIKEYFGFAQINYPNQRAKELHEKIFENLWELALAKTQKWQNQNPKLSGSLTQTVTQKQKIFLESLSHYNNYLRTP
jgi:hypothetical protein